MRRGVTPLSSSRMTRRTKCGGSAVFGPSTVSTGLLFSTNSWRPTLQRPRLAPGHCPRCCHSSPRLWLNVSVWAVPPSTSSSLKISGQVPSTSARVCRLPGELPVSLTTLGSSRPALGRWCPSCPPRPSLRTPWSFWQLYRRQEQFLPQSAENHGSRRDHSSYQFVTIPSLHFTSVFPCR